MGCQCRTLAHEGTGEPAHHDGVVDGGAGVGDANLQRLVLGGGADVPVDAGGTVDALGGDELSDDVVELGPRRQRFWRAGGRPAAEHLRAVAGVAGVDPLPERRARREGEERCQPRADVVHRGDGELALGHGHVDVAPEDLLLMGELGVADLQLAVGVLVGDLAVVGRGEGMRSSGGDGQTVLTGGGSDLLSQPAELGAHLRQRPADRGTGLDLGLVQLAGHFLVARQPARRRQDVTDTRVEGAAGGIDELEFLLDADREVLAAHRPTLPRDGPFDLGKMLSASDTGSPQIDVGTIVPQMRGRRYPRARWVDGPSSPPPGRSTPSTAFDRSAGPGGDRSR